jgi:nickel-dependent lactate racemase
MDQQQKKDIELVSIEYGDSALQFEKPEDADIIRRGSGIVDLPQHPNPQSAVREAINTPLGTKTLTDLVRPGSKVVIAFPDRVKGGSHLFSHRKTTIPIVLDELKRAGVYRNDIYAVCAIGLHRKNTQHEWLQYLGPDIVSQFSPSHILNHDAADENGITRLGEDEFGNVVDVNKFVADADLAIVLGHCLPNPYGGYSGGYKSISTGLTTPASIGSHHNPSVMYSSDYLPVSTKSDFRKRIDSIGSTIEERIGKKFFVIDAVLNTKSEILAVHAGNAELVQKECWELAEKQHRLKLKNRYDVFIVGQPRGFHYGPGMGTNPILMLQSLGALTARVYGAFTKQGIVVSASICDGWFNDEWFPSYRETYDLFQKNLNYPWEIVDYEQQLSNNPDYVFAYRFSHGYHGLHGCSMMYSGGFALRNTCKLIMVGAREPGYARSMGMNTVRTMDEALKSCRETLGNNLKIAILPEYFLNPVPFFTV